MPRGTCSTVRVAIAILIAVLFCSSPVLAIPVLTFNEATGTTGNNNSQSVGWQFDVLAPITVTGLGWFDEGANGLAMGHRVGIWAPDGTLLVFADVPAGVGAALDGQFRTVSVPSLVLAVGAGYIVGGQNFNTNTERLASNVLQSVNPSISFVDATFSDFGGFQRPTLFSIADTGFYGPSFSVDPAAAVPEPGTLLLLGSGIVGLAARRRRAS